MHSCKTTVLPFRRTCLNSIGCVASFAFVDCVFAEPNSGLGGCSRRRSGECLCTLFCVFIICGVCRRSCLSLAKHPPNSTFKPPTSFSSSFILASKSAFVNLLKRSTRECCSCFVIDFVCSDNGSPSAASSARGPSMRSPSGTVRCFFNLDPVLLVL